MSADGTEGDIVAEFEALRSASAGDFDAQMFERMAATAAAAERTAAAVERIAASEIAPALTAIATAVDRMALSAQAVDQIAHDVRAALQAGAALAEEFGPTARRAARGIADLVARYAPTTATPTRKR